MVSVVSLLRPARRANVDHVEELAASIAAGDTVAPEEVQAVLDRCRCSEEDLQRAVDRHIRVNDLRRQIAAGDGDAKRLAAIEAEVDAANAEVSKARAKLQAILDRVNEEHMTLRHRVDAVDRARRALLAEENLSPAQAERLRGVRIAADIASDAVTERRRELAEKRSRLRRAETELPKAELEASLRSASNDAKAAAERWRNAMKARTEAVADAEKALAAADEALAEAVAERSAVEASVARAVQAVPLPKKK